MKAAVAGRGLALVRAISVQWPTSFAYYAISTAKALQRPAVIHFREWLVEEAASVSHNS